MDLLDQGCFLGVSKGVFGDDMGADQENEKLQKNEKKEEKTNFLLSEIILLDIYPIDLYPRGILVSR